MSLCRCSSAARITTSVDALDGRSTEFSTRAGARDRRRARRPELARAGPCRRSSGSRSRGKLGGKVSFLLEGKASKGSGTIDLEIKDAAAGNSKDLTLKTPMGPFTLPRLAIGQLAIVGEAKDGQLKISKIGPGGKDVELAGDGRVQLRELATEAMLDLNLKFKVLDGYRGKNEKTELLFGKPGSKEKPFIERIEGGALEDGRRVLRVPRAGPWADRTSRRRRARAARWFGAGGARPDRRARAVAPEPSP